MCSSNDTKLLFDKLNIVFYICGLSQFWISKVQLSRKFIRFYDWISKATDVLVFFLTFLISGAIFTQKELTEAQLSDTVKQMALTLSMTLAFCNILWHRRESRELLAQLVTLLTARYHDKELEGKMIREIRQLSTLFFVLVLIVVVSGGIIPLIEAIQTGKAYVPIITAWPDINDRSSMAVAARLAFLVMWWLFQLRIVGLYIMLLTMMNCVCYQYKNLQSYFYSLERIFNDTQSDLQEKERKYEQKFKSGIHMHIQTLQSTRQYQLIGNNIFAAEITLAMVLMVSELLSLLMSGSDMSTLLAVIPYAVTTLCALAFFMWNAGDITYEAACLSEAMYASGWQNCTRHSSTRVRKLVVTAMSQAQNPVVIQCYGIINLSYETFVKIIKSSYTVVSVFY